MTGRPRLELLFVHVAKAGGSAVRCALVEKYGDRLLVDDDRPALPTSPMNIDPDGFLAHHHAGDYAALDGKDAVTGHVWARKYEGIACHCRATILRHPVDRAVSHYYFWQASDEPHPVRQYVVEHGLGLTEFAALPIVRWFYTRQLFRDCDMAAFDWIADYAALSEDWAGVMRRLGLDMRPIRVNETQARMPDYAARRAEVLADRRQVDRLHRLFADDIRFYERALARH